MSTYPAELTGTWEIDATHSTVGFAAKHAMIATTRGHFTTFKGGATINAESPETLSYRAQMNKDGSPSELISLSTMRSAVAVCMPLRLALSTSRMALLTTMPASMMMPM